MRNRHFAFIEMLKTQADQTATRTRKTKGGKKEEVARQLGNFPVATFHSSSNPDRIFYPKRFRIGNSIRQGFFFRKPRQIGFLI